MTSSVTFIISSVIYFSDKRLSYSIVRSTFTPAQRSKQTLQTIASIRRKVPAANIVLIEMGTKKNIDTAIIQAADQFIYAGSNLFVKWAAGSRHKGLGEAAGLLVAAKKLKGNAGMYFKISGRYLLNDGFDINKWEGNNFFFRKYGEGISTRLYAFHHSLFDVWVKAIRKSLYQLYMGKSIEDVLPLHLNNTLIKEINPLGVSGLVGPDGQFLSE